MTELVRNNGKPRRYPPSISSESSSCSEDSQEDFQPDFESADQPTATPLQLAIRNIELRIKCLMRLSVYLRQPTPRDYQKKLSLPENRMDDYLPYDIRHVKEKVRQIACTVTIPSKTNGVQEDIAKYDTPTWLINRLGSANTRRRELLRYHHNHHETIARYVDALPVNMPVAVLPETFETRNEERDSAQDKNENRQAPMTVATQTTVTTVHDVSRSLKSLENEVMSEGGQTMTSFGTSKSWNDGHDFKIDVPQPPVPMESLGDQPFEVSSLC